jgi:putative redox protein
MADARVRLSWQGGQRFAGGAEGGPEALLDGSGVAGVSPVTTLLLALAGCMGADIVDILEKMRIPPASLELEVEADRRAEPPRWVTRAVLRVRTTGIAAADREKVERAIRLSRDTYCSVLHTLRGDLEFETELELG